jgi:asparagine N-glycosylation enzyme membrane subunit Stt3
MVLLHDPKSVTIGISIADAGGKASVTYNCNYQPYSITSCSFTNSCLNVLVTEETSLPVKLAGFTAEMTKNNSVVLNWKSSLEHSSARYIVEKSYDGRNFKVIGEVKAAGDTDKPVNYSYTDITYNGAVNYFRLKQTDVDGRFEYSRTVYVSGKNDGAGIKSISSNAFTGEIQLAGIDAPELLNDHINVYNTSGQQVACRVTGRSSISIGASAPSGIYFLRIKDQTFKLVKN